MICYFFMEIVNGKDTTCQGVILSLWPIYEQNCTDWNYVHYGVA